LLLATALAPGVALAQVSDRDKAAARQLTLDGLTALQRKGYAGAADLFERADALFHAPTEMPAAVLGVKQPIDPGRHVVRAVARGFTPASAPVEVVEGRTATVTAGGSDLFLAKVDPTGTPIWALSHGSVADEAQSYLRPRPTAA
jgi:hypothetical protein